MIKKLFPLLIIALLTTTSCVENQNLEISLSGDSWKAGYSTQEIQLPEEGNKYIAGYHQGHEVQDIFDKQSVSAMYLGNNSNGSIIISIDCVALAKNYCDIIRNELKNITSSVNIYSTHTHAGLDTLGLWGEIAQEGKNKEFLNNLVQTSISVGKEAYENSKEGDLYFGYSSPYDLQYDSRKPIVFDSNLYQFRFVPKDNSNNIRLINYAAHAESLRGSNYNLSSDYPGMLRKNIKDLYGDDVLFIQGAIGGLIMTKELVSPFDPYENLIKTSNYLIDSLLSINNERKLNCSFKIASKSYKTRLDNTLFMYYKFLGILDNEIVPGDGQTGYSLKTRASIFKIDDIIIYCVPGELFPELAYTSEIDVKTETLDSLSTNKTLVFGLCNDEIGYIIPPYDYLLNEKTPYLDTVKGLEENHYEETNSTSIESWNDLLNCYKNLLNYV